MTSNPMRQEFDELFKGKLYLNVDDVAKLLGCEEKIVHNWTRRSDSRRRPPRIIVGKEVRFPKYDLLDWLELEQVAARDMFS